MRIKQQMPDLGGPRREVYDAMLGFAIAFTACGGPVNYELACRERRRFLEHAGCLGEWLGADHATQLISLVYSMQDWLYWCEPGDPDINDDDATCRDDEIVIHNDGPPDARFVFSVGQEIHKWLDAMEALFAAGGNRITVDAPKAIAWLRGTPHEITGDQVRVLDCLVKAKGERLMNSQITVETQVSRPGGVLSRLPTELRAMISTKDGHDGGHRYLGD